MISIIILQFLNLYFMVNYFSIALVTLFVPKNMGIDKKEELATNRMTHFI